MARFECVRITDMRDVDLSLWRFDFDLKFAVLMAAADGTVLHRYGGRDHHSADGWLSVKTLTETLRAARATFAQHVDDPTPRASRTLTDLPIFNRRYNEQGACVHCHTVHTVERLDAIERDAWHPEKRWVWPQPERVGLTLDRADPVRVAAVAADSAAARAGVRVGDRIERVGSVSVRSRADLQWSLHKTGHERSSLELRLVRGADAPTVKLALDPGWKRASPLEWSWRSFKWNLTPAPGFGGTDLTAQELLKLGLAAGHSAFRVTYLVTWGERAHTGRNAATAGICKDDVILSVAGKRDFVDQEHFHAWFRLTRRVGETVPIELLRGGQRHHLSLVVVE